MPKSDTQFKPGQSGNPNGRPKGSRNKLSESFLQDALEAWNESGKEALRTMANEKPNEFARMIASIIPKEDTIEHSGINGRPIETITLDMTPAQAAQIYADELRADD